MKKLILFLSVSTSLLFAQGYKIGDEAKDFKLRNIDNNLVSLKDSKEAKGFIVVFTCNHCPFAQAYEQRIIDLDKKFRPLGFPVVAINSNDPKIVPDDSYDNMVKTAKDKSYPFPYLFDESQEIAKAFGATKTPHVYILNKNKSKLVVSYIGAIDNNTDDPDKADKKYVEDAVNELLAGKTVTVTETKAIGCGIKWRK
jgi:peroxiredoxin